MQRTTARRRHAVVKAKKQPKGKKRSAKDLPVKGKRARDLKGGLSTDVTRTPSPGGPVAIPYPNTG